MTLFTRLFIATLKKYVDTSAKISSVIGFNMVRASRTGLLLFLLELRKSSALNFLPSSKVSSIFYRADPTLKTKKINLCESWYQVEIIY